MAAHPYFPRSLSLPAFVPNTLSMEYIVGVFFIAVGFLLLTLNFLSGRFGISGSNRFAVLWFGLCAFIHIVIEGYFVLFNKTILSETFFLGQLWKEYAQSDSRYLVSDPTVLMIELITSALEGPACIAIVYYALKQQPMRYVLQILVSAGQLYGCILYYLCAWYMDFKDTDPHPFYFYGYFVCMNFPWIAIPIWMLYDGLGVVLESAVVKQKKESKRSESVSRGRSMSLRRRKVA